MRNVFLFFCFTCLVADAQNIEAYLSAPFPSDLTASADGKIIAWVFNDKGSRNIYAAEAPLYQAKKLTNYSGDNGVAISNVSFIPGGVHLLYVMGNTANTRGEAANPAQLQISTERAIYMIPASGGRERKIATGFSPEIAPDGQLIAYITGGQVWSASLTDTAIKPQKLFQSRGTQGQLSFSPNGKSLAFTSSRGDHSLVGIYDFSTKSISFPDASLYFDRDPAWSADGATLAYNRFPGPKHLEIFGARRTANPWSLRTWHTPTATAKEIWKAAPGPGSRFWHPSSTAFHWAGDDQIIFSYEKTGWAQLYVLDVASRKSRLLTPGDGEVESMALSPDKKTLYYCSNAGDIDRRHIWKVNIEDGKAESITKGSTLEYSPVVTTDGIALLQSSASKPLWPAVLKNGTLSTIATNFFPTDYPTDFVQPQAITLKANDGIASYGQLFLPAAKAGAAKKPALIFLHGGSRRQMLLGFHNSSYYWATYAMNQYLASQGFVVLSLNYRSGTGYGLNFREALNYGPEGASEVQDVIAAALFLRSRSDVDPQKIGLWGGSYGGYLTAHGLAQRPDLFACGVDIHGVHNWNTSLPVFIPDYDVAKIPEAAKLAFRSSPLHFVKGWKDPVLLIHGDDDRNVLFSESVLLADILTAQGVELEHLVLADEIHNFLLHRNWVKALDATASFFRRRLK